MRIGRPRFTVRAMMILVAIAAILLAGRAEVARLRKISDDHRFNVALFASMEKYERASATSDDHLADGTCQARFVEAQRRYEKSAASPTGTDHDKRDIAFLKAKAEKYRSDVDSLRHWAAMSRRRAEYYAGLRRKYSRLADYPWLSSPPVPTRPSEFNRPGAN